MTARETLIDLIYTELSKKAKMPFPLPESAVKKTIGEVIDSINTHGYAIVKGNVALCPDANAVFCPHCRKDHPSIGVNVGTMDLQGSTLAVLTIFCGHCHTILHVNVTQAPPQPRVQ
jgi:hypothetical protein